MKRILFGCLLGLAALASTARSQAQMVIIANSGLKIENISKDELREIFTGASANLHSGARVKPVLLKKGAPQDEFLATYIGVKEAQFRSDWMSLLFAGKMLMPPSVDEAEVVEYVASHPFAIGYVHKGTPHPDVIVLAVK